MYKFKHDAEEIEFSQDEAIIVATDNSGAIGMKPLDTVHVDYKTMSYYAFRVAYMECVAAGGEPFSVIMHNFNDEMVWDELISGITLGLKEVGLANISITGSTETNFKLDQSALGLVILGKKIQQKKTFLNAESVEMAIIGKPLVGQAVKDNEKSVAPLRIYEILSKMPEVTLIRPISSKGIKYEVDRQINQPFIYPTGLDIQKSAGPATCFLVVYDSKIHDTIKELAGEHLQMIKPVLNL